MKKLWLPLTMIAVLVAIAVAGYWAKRPPESESIACSDPVAGCDFRHRGAAARVRFSELPVPLEPFGLSVTAPGSARVSVEFQMVGMDMGFNRYDLRPLPDGTFSSRITLPVCISERQDWLLYLQIDGNNYVLPFSSR
jgi:hypothetical protein